MAFVTDDSIGGLYPGKVLSSDIPLASPEGAETDPGINDPEAGPADMSSAQAAQILAGINPTTGRYDPSVTANKELITQARIAFGYDTPTGAPGPRTVGGTPTGAVTSDERAAANQTPTVSELLGATGATSDFTPGFQTGLTTGGPAPMGGQPLNERFLADQSTTEWLAKQLGGEMVQTAGGSWPGGGNPDQYAIRLPNGQVINAGAIATKLNSIQQNYQRGVDNYQLNLRQNPNIVGTGRLQAPTSPMEQLKAWLGGPETGDPTDRQPQVRGDPVPQRFVSPGGGGGLAGAGPAGQSRGGAGSGYGGQGQPYGNDGILIPGYGGGGVGTLGNLSGPAGFGGGLNFASAPNSLYYPNMRGTGYAGFGGVSYGSGSGNRINPIGPAGWEPLGGGGGFPGGYGQQQPSMYSQPQSGPSNLGSLGSGGPGSVGQIGQTYYEPRGSSGTPWGWGEQPTSYGQFQNPLKGFGNMGDFANFNNAMQNYMQQPQQGQQGQQPWSQGQGWSQGRNLYNRAPQF